MFIYAYIYACTPSAPPHLGWVGWVGWGVYMGIYIGIYIYIYIYIPPPPASSPTFGMFVVAKVSGDELCLFPNSDSSLKGSSGGLLSPHLMFYLDRGGLPCRCVHAYFLM